MKNTEPPDILPPHPADLEWRKAEQELKRRLTIALECEARYLRVKRMIQEAYRAAFDRAWPNDREAREALPYGGNHEEEDPHTSFR